MDFKEVSKHNNKSSCWVVLYDKVYDVTSFLPSHPGGAKTILRLAGADATEQYDPIHPPGTLESSLPAEALLGDLDTSTIPEPPPPSPAPSPSAASSSPTKPTPPPLSTLLSLTDIERAAKPLLSRKAWAYYYSAADDLFSKSLNSAVYASILLRPRVFVDCTRCDPSTTLLRHTPRPIRSPTPFFVSPAAMARLAHPTGERGIAAACAAAGGVVQIISNNASMTPEQIVEGASEGQTFGWQLYVQTQRAKSEEMLRRVERLDKVRFVVLTLDAPVPGKREDDERANIAENGVEEEEEADEDADGAEETKGDGNGWRDAVRAAATVAPFRGGSDKEQVEAPKEGEVGTAQKSEKEEEKGGLGKYLFAGTAADLTWSTTLPWLAQHTRLPIVLKGIQTHEDAYSAMLRAPQVAGIILSNHGGRAADTAPPAIHTLLEIRKYCPEVFDRIDVWVDGGIKRGTDVVKALCLGARAVGVGRAPLYGLGVGGPKGVERVFTILSEEVATGMRLLGCEKVEQLGPRHVNARIVERDVFDGGRGELEGGLWNSLKAKL